MNFIVGVICGEGTPVPIPNTVVKLIYADNTCLVTSREDRSMPTQERQVVWLGFFVVIKCPGVSVNSDSV